MEPVFYIRDAVSFGWHAANKYIRIYIVAALLYGVIYLLEYLCRKFIYPEVFSYFNIHSWGGMFFSAWFMKLVIFSYPATALHIGIRHVSLRVRDFEYIKTSQFFVYFKDMKFVLSVFIGHFLILIITIFGTALLIIPGIIFGMMLSQFAYCMIENKLTVLQGMKMSIRLTKASGFKSQFFFLGVIFIGIHMLGFLALGIGLLFTFPAMWIADAFAYRALVPRPIEPGGEIVIEKEMKV